MLLGEVESEYIQKALTFFDTLKVTNHISAQTRENGSYGVEHNETTPLGKTYNQRHTFEQLEHCEILRQFNGLFYQRFADLDADAVVPAHLDDPYSYQYLLVLAGDHMFVADKNVTMKAGQLWFINPAYKHEIINNGERRIALLGRFEIDEHNTELLRARA